MTWPPRETVPQSAILRYVATVERNWPQDGGGYSAVLWDRWLRPGSIVLSCPHKHQTQATATPCLRLIRRSVTDGGI